MTSEYVPVIPESQLLGLQTVFFYSGIFIVSESVCSSGCEHSSFANLLISQCLYEGQLIGGKLSSENCGVKGEELKTACFTVNEVMELH